MTHNFLIWPRLSRLRNNAQITLAYYDTTKSLCLEPDFGSTQHPFWEKFIKFHENMGFTVSPHLVHFNDNYNPLFKDVYSDYKAANEMQCVVSVDEYEKFWIGDNPYPLTPADQDAEMWLKLLDRAQRPLGI